MTGSSLGYTRNLERAWTWRLSGDTERSGDRERLHHGRYWRTTEKQMVPPCGQGAPKG